MYMYDCMMRKMCLDEYRFNWCSCISCICSMTTHHNLSKYGKLWSHSNDMMNTIYINTNCKNNMIYETLHRNYERCTFEYTTYWRIIWLCVWYGAQYFITTWYVHWRNAHQSLLVYMIVPIPIPHTQHLRIGKWEAYPFCFRLLAHVRAPVK